MRALHVAPTPGPLAAKIGLAPVRLDFDRSRRNAEILSTGAERYAPEANTERLGAALAEALSTEGRAAAVVPVPAAERPAALAAAHRAGLDLVVLPRLARYEAVFAGTNGLYLPNWALWFMLWFPSWWVADERYAVEAEVDVEVVDVRSERTVRRAIFGGRVERDLDDHDRGLTFLGLPYYPGSLEPEHYAQAAGVLAPHVERELALSLVADARGPLREALAEGAVNRGTTFAVTAGVSRYSSYAAHNLKFASSDAVAWHALLSVRSGAVPAKNHALLLDDRATRAGLLAAVDEAVARARPEDAVVVYFAGYGATAGGKLVLAPFDADPAALERTGVGLDEVSERLARARIRGAAIVLDCGFAGPQAGRSLLPDPAVAPWPPLERVSILAACGPGERTLELDDLGRGLFTHHMVAALSGEADRDRDGRVALAEAFAVAAERAAAQAALEGVNARPRLLGGDSIGRLGLVVEAKR